MGQISRNLISKGWTLAVLPELDDLTVGGLIMGFGIEASSHKYGLFQFICASFDLVTADGSVSIAVHLKCGFILSDTVEPWHPGGFGRRRTENHPAKKYVRVHYQPVYALDNMVEVFEEASRKNRRKRFRRRLGL